MSMGTSLGFTFSVLCLLRILLLFVSWSYVCGVILLFVNKKHVPSRNVFILLLLVNPYWVMLRPSVNYGCSYLLVTVSSSFLHVAALVRPCMLADNCGRCVFLHRKSILLQKSKELHRFVARISWCCCCRAPPNQLELWYVIYTLLLNSSAVDCRSNLFRSRGECRGEPPYLNEL